MTLSLNTKSLFLMLSANPTEEMQEQQSIKVLFVNNYSMDGALSLWEKGEYPGQHLWGATTLYNYDIKVDILPFKKYKSLKVISKIIKILGDLDLQWRVLLLKSDYDVIYSGHHLTTAMLAFLRQVGLFDKPIIAIAYQSFEKSLFSDLFTQLFVRGNDKLLCLSHGIEEDLSTNFSIPSEKLEILEWGNDLSFYKIDLNDMSKGDHSNEKFILSAGKSSRDYEVLVEAFNEIDSSLIIHGYGKEIFSDNRPIPKNVSVPKEFLSMQSILAEYQRSYFVAIPLAIPKSVNNAIGLTSLLEAMSMGKAVVMTRNKFVSIDIEKEGIGIFVEPKDIDGWRKAISYLIDHPEVVAEMGWRARKLCEEKYSLKRFTANLAGFLKNAVGH